MFKRNTNDDLSKSSLWHPPDLCGVLEKQGRGRGAWRARYFILKGSNLFWFNQPTSKKPQGHVPLEGATIHAIKPPAISVYTHHMAEQERNGMPLLYGIILMLDEGYASSPGGRAELVLAAASAELQALWCKALQQASIPRPQLLAKLHQNNKLSEVLGEFGPVRSVPANSNTSRPSHVYSAPRHSATSSYQEVHPGPLATPTTPQTPQPLTRMSSIPSAHSIRFASPQPRASFGEGDPRRPVSDAGVGLRQSFAFHHDLHTSSPVLPPQEQLPALSPRGSIAYSGSYNHDGHSQGPSSHGRHRTLSVPYTSASLPMSEEDIMAYQLGPPFVPPAPESAYGSSNSSARQSRGKSPLKTRAEKFLNRFFGMKSLFGSNDSSHRQSQEDGGYQQYTGMYELPPPMYVPPSPTTARRIQGLAPRSPAMSDASWATPPISPIVTYGSTLDTGSQVGSTSSAVGALRSVSPSASIGAVGGSFVHGIINDWTSGSQQEAGSRTRVSSRATPLSSANSHRSSIAPSPQPASRKSSLLPLEPLNQPRSSSVARERPSLNLNSPLRTTSAARSEHRSSILATPGLDAILSRSPSARASSLLTPASPPETATAQAVPESELLTNVATAQQQVSRAFELLAQHASELTSSSTSPGASRVSSVAAKTAGSAARAAVAAEPGSSTPESKAEKFVSTITQLQASLDRVKASLSQSSDSHSIAVAHPSQANHPGLSEPDLLGLDARHSAALQALSASKKQLESCLTILQDVTHMNSCDSHALAAVTVSVQRALAEMYLQIHGVDYTPTAFGGNQWSGVAQVAPASDHAAPSGGAVRTSVSFSGFSPGQLDQSGAQPLPGLQDEAQFVTSRSPSMSTPMTPRKSDAALVIGPGGAVGLSSVTSSGVLQDAQQRMEQLASQRLGTTSVSQFAGDGGWNAFTGIREASVAIPDMGGARDGDVSRARESVTLSMHDVQARLMALSSSLQERSERASIDSSELDSPANSARRMAVSNADHAARRRLASDVDLGPAQRPSLYEGNRASMLHSELTAGARQGGRESSSHARALQLNSQGYDTRTSVMSSADHNTRASVQYSPDQLTRQSVLNSQGYDTRTSVMSSADNNTRASVQYSPDQLTRQSVLNSQGYDTRTSVMSSADNNTRASVQYSPDQLTRQSILSSQGYDTRTSVMSSADNNTRASVQYSPDQLTRQSVLNSQGYDTRTSVMSSADNNTRASVQYSPDQLTRQSVLNSQGYDTRTSVMSSADNNTRASVQYSPDQLTRQSVLNSQGYDTRTSVMSSADNNTRASVQYSPDQLTRQSVLNSQGYDTRTSGIEQGRVSTQLMSGHQAERLPGHSHMWHSDHLQQTSGAEAVGMSINIQQAARHSILAQQPQSRPTSLSRDEQQVTLPFPPADDLLTSSRADVRMSGVNHHEAAWLQPLPAPTALSDLADQEPFKAEVPQARSSFHFSVVSRHSDHEHPALVRLPSTTAYNSTTTAQPSMLSMGDQDAMARQSIAVRLGSQSVSQAWDAGSRLSQHAAGEGGESWEAGPVLEPAPVASTGGVKVPSALVPVSQVMQEEQLRSRSSYMMDARDSSQNRDSSVGAWQAARVSEPAAALHYPTDVLGYHSARTSLRDEWAQAGGVLGQVQLGNDSPGGYTSVHAASQSAQLSGKLEHSHKLSAMSHQDVSHGFQVEQPLESVQRRARYSSTDYC